MSVMLVALLLVETDGFSKTTVGTFQEEARARVAIIDNLLGAMARRDQKAFKSLGGDGVAFSSDPEAVFAFVVRPAAPRLTIDSFAALASCKAGRPQSSATDWYTVTWACSQTSQADDAHFSFRFAGRKLIAVQATRRPPKAKILT